MSITILQLAAKVTADTKDAEASLKNVKQRADEAGGDSGGGGIKGFLARVAMIGAGVGIIGGVVGAFTFLKDQVTDSVNAANAYQLVQAQTNAVLASTKGVSGQTAESIAKLAESFSTTTTFSKEATQGAENMLLTFTNIKGNLPQVTGATLDFATAMHMDATSAALQLGKALNDPATGYTKLQREGVTFTKAQVEAIKSMEKAGNIAGAQGIILGELQKEFGGSAKAAGATFAGSLQILQNQLEDTKVKIGAALIPVLSQLLTAIAPLMQAFAQFVSGALGGLSSFLTGTIIPTFQQWMPVIGAIVQGAQILGNIFLSALRPALDQIGQAFSKAHGPGLNVKDAMTAVTGVVQKLVPFIQQAGLVIGRLATIFVTDVLPVIQKFVAFVVANVLPVLGQFANFIITQVVPVVQQLVGFFIANVLPVLAQIADIIIKNVVPALMGIVSSIMTNVWPAVKNLIGALENLWQKISPVLIPVLQFLGWVLQNVIAPVITHVILPAIGFLINVVVGVINVVATVIGALGHLGDVFGGIGKIATSVWSGIQGAFKAGVNLIISDINSFISFLDGIQIHIPAVGVGPVKTPAFDWGGPGIPQIPYLAEGGDITRGGDVVVGDRGAERLTLPTGARVTPLPAGLGGFGGGFGGGSPQMVQVETTINLDGYRLAQVVTKHQPTVIRNTAGRRDM